MQKNLKLKKKLSILKPAFTRFLTVHKAIQRILKRWTALQIFFKKEAAKDKKSEKIYENLLDPLMELYLNS